MVAAFDDAFDRALDRIRGNPIADRVMYMASTLGDWSVLWHLVAISRALATPQRRRESLRLSAVLAVESLVVNQGVKRLFKRVRPATDGDHPHRLRTPSTSSFPSGHASAAFCAARLLADASPAAAALWYGLAGIVALSRPYVRIHHASDTVAGAFLGLAIGEAARKIWSL